ncbi:MAG: MFS transporter [Pseudomonadales bacterium]|nr:MFS transporter [Pseudomonadales bacterium]
MSVFLHKYRTLMVLVVAQCFGQTAAPILVLLGGIVGAQIAPSHELATLPLAIMIAGTACATVPASMLMARFGRKTGFVSGTALAIAAGLIAAWSIEKALFSGFCFASFLIGNYLAFLQQFRFAAAESVSPDDVPKSLSILMLAGIVAAIIGPEAGERFSRVDGLRDFVGSFLGLSVLMTVSLVILLVFYRNTSMESEEVSGEARPLKEVLSQPTLMLAMSSAVVSYTVMSLIMTATPVSMHEMDHHSLEDTTWVVQSHILAMYIPSLFSGILVMKFGVMRIIQSGFVILVACVLVGWGKPELAHYWGALVLLGIGWNFMFLGGTTLLTQTYRASERFKVQALNDFLIFGLQAVGSLGAGLLLASLGWKGVMAFSVPWLILLLPAMVLVIRQRDGVK